jgi:hypothetical protein
MNRRNPPIPRSLFVAPQQNMANDDLENLYSLIEQGNFGAIPDFLLGSIMDVNTPYGGKCLPNTIINVDPGLVSEEKKVELLDILVTRKNMYLRTYDEHGLTPLHCAVANGYAKIMDYLLDKSVNIDAQTEKNLTPLHYATLLNLKACPPENTAKPLIEPVKSDVKSSDITSQLIKMVESDTVYITVDHGDILMKNQFEINTDPLIELYEILVDEQIMSMEQELKQTITETKSSNVTDSNIVELLFKKVNEKFQKLQYPDNIMNSDMEVFDFNTGDDATDILPRNIDMYMTNLKSTIIPVITERVTQEIKTMKDQIKHYDNNVEPRIYEIEIRLNELFDKYNIGKSDNNIKKKLLENIYGGVIPIISFISIFNKKYDFKKLFFLSTDNNFFNNFFNSLIPDDSVEFNNQPTHLHNSYIYNLLHI